MSNKLTAMSFQELEQSTNNSLWVFNNTKPKGRVHFMATQPNGKELLVTVENTWIPLDLTTRATRKSLIESADLRKLHSSGRIKFVTPESAEEFMKSPDAKKESQRVDERMGEIQTGQFEVTGADKSGTQNGADAANEPSLRVINMAGMDEEINITNLRTNADEMTRADLEYLVRESTQPKLKALAAEMLSELVD